MSLSILIDMNLSTEWVQVLEDSGWSAVHWSNVGAVDAEDQELCSRGGILALNPTTFVSAGN